MLVHESRHYCTANPQFKFASKSDYADQCGFAPKCRQTPRPKAAWLTGRISRQPSDYEHGRDFVADVDGCFAKPPKGWP
jgi:hypothetical protein